MMANILINIYCNVSKLTQAHNICSDLVILDYGDYKKMLMREFIILLIFHKPAIINPVTIRNCDSCKRFHIRQLLLKLSGEFV